jgi:DNA-directed RNA polymerase specialized sigma24 family protein
MIKKIFNKKAQKEAKELLTLELSEILEIAEQLYKKIDERINALKEIEERIDGKIETVRHLITKSEDIEKRMNCLNFPNHREISILSEKGLSVDEIADFFDIPKGEVELILNIFKDNREKISS